MYLWFPKATTPFGIPYCLGLLDIFLGNGIYSETPKQKCDERPLSKETNKYTQRDTDTYDFSHLGTDTIVNFGTKGNPTNRNKLE